MGAGFLVPIESDRPVIIKPVNLGRDGVVYVRSLLMEQNNPLSTAVAKLLNSGGRAFAPLEQGETLAEAKQFNTGRSRPTVAIQQWFADYIEEQWGYNGYQVVFEDPWETPDGCIIRRENINYFFSGSGVYYTSDHPNLYDAMETVKRQSNFLFFGFVVSPAVPLPPSGTSVDQDYIELLTQNTQAVFIRSYDWEGYVVWQR